MACAITATVRAGRCSTVWMSHGDRGCGAAGLRPCGFHEQRAARGDARRVAPLRRAPIPKSRTRLQGLKILERFVQEISGCEALAARQHHHGSSPCARWSGATKLLGLSGASTYRSSERCCIVRSATSPVLGVRRSRPAAPRRRRPGDGDVRQAHGREGDSRQCRSALPRRTEGRERSRAQAQDHRPAVRRSVRGGSGSCRASAGWPRARSIPT